MSKEIIFNLSKNQLINSNSKKEFLEKSYYLDDGIDKCLIKNQKIYFFFNKTLNSSKKNFLNKKIKRLINRLKAIDIDNDSDWNFAESIMNSKHTN